MSNILIITTAFLQGLGGLLLKELARRLKDVGLLTLFCWGDQESESFWSKQVCSKRSYNTYVSGCEMIEKLFVSEHPMIHGFYCKTPMHPCNPWIQHDPCL